jgi:hypothetical protein
LRLDIPQETTSIRSRWLEVHAGVRADDVQVDR